MGLSGGPNHLEIVFPKHWFGANPLTHADLIEEQEFLEARGFALVLKAGDGNGAAAAEPLTQEPAGVSGRLGELLE
jgi:hypothetical protein